MSDKSGNNNREDGNRETRNRTQAPSNNQDSNRQQPIIVIVPQSRSDPQEQRTQFFPIRRSWNDQNSGNRPLVAVNRDSTRITCPNCRATVNTIPAIEPAHPKCFFITTLLTMPLCCIVWPCMVACLLSPCCQKIKHYCPNCDAHVGTFGR